MIWKVFLLAPFVVMSFMQTSQAQRVRLRAQMGAKDQVQATAKFEQKVTRLKFNVEVEDGKANTGFRVVVSRGGKTIFSRSLRTNKFGFGEIDLDTSEGDKLRAMQAGDRVIIRSTGVRLVGTLR